MDRNEVARAAKRIENAERARDIVSMYDEGQSFRQIADHFSLAVSTVHAIYRRQMAKITGPVAEAHRNQQIRLLDIMRDELLGIMRGKYYAISSRGDVVTFDHDDGRGPQPVADVDPNLKAIQTLLNLEQRHSSLLGLDAAKRTEIDVTQVNYTIVGVDPSVLGDDPRPPDDPRVIDAEPLDDDDADA